MDYPAAVIDKAQRLERLLQRVEAGEPFESVRSELDLKVDAAELAKWQARYVAGGRQWQALLDGRYGHTRVVNSAMREWLYQRKRADPTLRAPALATELAQAFGVRVAAGHINYLLRKVALTSPPGRPYKAPPAAAAPPETVSGRPVDSSGRVPPSPPPPSLANAGLFFPRSREGGPGDRRTGCDDPGDRHGGLPGQPTAGRAARPQQ